MYGMSFNMVVLSQRMEVEVVQMMTRNDDNDDNDFALTIIG